MVGLGRVVGAGSDLVVLWSPGTNGETAVAQALRRVVCLLAEVTHGEALLGLRATAAALTAARTPEEAVTALRAVAEGLEALRAPTEAITLTIQTEC